MDLSLQSAAYIEEMYQKYRQDPQLVDREWREFLQQFDKLPVAKTNDDYLAVDFLAEDFLNNSKVEAMIDVFRRRGHLYAQLDPLKESPTTDIHLNLSNYDLDQVDRRQVFYPANLVGIDKANLSEIIDVLNRSYCGAIGVDFVEINNEERVIWIREHLEKNHGRPQFNPTERQRILQRLIAADSFERFLHNRYLGQKRFSLEGCDVLIAMLDFILRDAARHTIEEICIGMAHRGRLNVLANFMQKNFTQIFREFEGSVADSFDIDGDVKYHLGFDSRVTVDQQEIDLCLLPNPSHLEAVNPVLEGYVRARQRLKNDQRGKKVLPILIHGDASFSGQGVVFETLNLSKLEAYDTGGTVHIIINNQIGFTTDQDCARSTEYCSDIVKAIRAPVFHVNADDPEAAVWTALMALSYRQRFASDVVIDIVGYRRYGHNEGDEPAFTQPLMYRKIANHQRVVDLYRQQFADDEIDRQLTGSYKSELEDAYKQVKNGNPTNNRRGKKLPSRPVKTAVDRQTLKQLVDQITTVPEGFTVHPKIDKIFANRRAMCDGDGAIDWALAELLAIATLADSGRHVRLSGQDSQRGTFSSRHAVVADVETGESWPIFASFGTVDVINTPLSEYGALGFEFGYSIVDQQTLVLWEAQFGDFANGAQIIIDQFVVSSEAKWGQTSGLVLLLPHGYEGMGPEHSNARPERFLQLCGNDNIQVANPTTPAQYFHILRRQVLRNVVKPLVIMSPKSLLRHPKVVSPLVDFGERGFQEVVDDQLATVDKVKRLILCSGKIFYELEARRAKLAIDDVAIVRFEQLFPFPAKVFVKILNRYPQVTDLCWVQEEPRNMGAWDYLRPRLLETTELPVTCIGRKTAGSTAEGYTKTHNIAQNRILTEALPT